MLSAAPLRRPRLSDDHFAEITVEGYFRAGSPAASEWDLGDFEDVSCVRCGAKIGHVFMTNHGPMGGDCLATLTGDDTTRRVVRQIRQKLANWAATNELYGFQVGTSERTGATIRGLYTRDGRTWDKLLWATDSLPAAFIHGVVEQFTQQWHRSLVFRAAIERAHVQAQARRQDARKAEVDARVQDLRTDGRKIAEVVGLAEHYKSPLHTIDQSVPGTRWRPCPHAEGGHAEFLLNETGHSGNAPELIARARAAGFVFVRDTRDGLLFLVPSVEAMEEAAAGRGTAVPTLDGEAFERGLAAGLDPVDALFAATPEDPSAVRLQARIDSSKAAIQRYAEDKADFYARKLAMDRYGSAKLLG